ncbi:hypothetical protein ScPMuIL_009999 [Solemya velum]
MVVSLKQIGDTTSYLSQLKYTLLQLDTITATCHDIIEEIYYGDDIRMIARKHPDKHLDQLNRRQSIYIIKKTDIYRM